MSQASYCVCSLTPCKCRVASKAISKGYKRIFQIVLPSFPYNANAQVLLPMYLYLPSSPRRNLAILAVISDMDLSLPRGELSLSLELGLPSLFKVSSVLPSICVSMGFPFSNFGVIFLMMVSTIPESLPAVVGRINRLISVSPSYKLFVSSS